VDEEGTSEFRKLHDPPRFNPCEAYPEVKRTLDNPAGTQFEITIGAIDDAVRTASGEGTIVLKGYVKSDC
jgi:hypothetical protein